MQQTRRDPRTAFETPEQRALRQRVTACAAEISSAVQAARRQYADRHPDRGHPSDQVLAVAVGRGLSFLIKTDKYLPGWTFTDETLRVLGTPTLIARWLHPYAWRVMLRDGWQWDQTGAGILQSPHPAPPRQPARRRRSG
jgi:hypothetical protein